tara:strand:- start:6 stop:224 length:219 start_codon:yes stop_codon:yes gene_type:complete
MWFKKETRSGLNIWETPEGVFISAYKTNNTRGEDIWGVSSTSKKYYANDSFFETRQEAINEAMDFMKRNPNG